MHSLIGMPYSLLTDVSGDVIGFAKETGYLLDAEDLRRARQEYSAAIQKILSDHADTSVVLESYEEDGMYVVSASAGLQLRILGNNVVYINAVPFVVKSDLDKGESND